MRSKKPADCNPPAFHVDPESNMAGISQSNAIGALKAVPMFSGLDEAVLRDLLNNCRELAFHAGELILLPAQKAERSFVILSGKVKIFQLSAKGDEQILHLYGPGETFGEAAMWAGVNYPAHAEAVTDARLLAISRQTLRTIIARNPDVAMGMLAGMSVKLQEFTVLVERLSLKEVPARLAAVLLGLSRQAGSPTFRLPQTKRQLAAQIGTVAETLSRALAKLKKDGLIEVRGSRITILQAEGLGNLAQSG